MKLTDFLDKVIEAMGDPNSDPELVVDLLDKDVTLKVESIQLVDNILYIGAA